ncbi:MAG: DUF362 domain-containing protein [Nitrospiraceae bacterium]|nr:MAG: DUF362 domain-containing protein [Nitrospiraceae bacterium]
MEKEALKNVRTRYERVTLMASKHKRTEPMLNRRQFLLKTAVTCGITAGAGVWGYIFYSRDPVRRRTERILTFKNFRVDDSAEYPSMVIVRGKSVEQMTHAAVEELGGMSRFISPGNTVLIKPNVGWDRQPEQAANTNPELVAAVVKECRAAGAARVWVTDVSINDPYRSFARSGIESAVKQAGGTIRFTTEKDFVLTDLKGQILQVWPVSRFYHEADKVINLPVVKHHSLSRCTIAMKNWYGILGGRRNRLHQEINTSIADLAAAVRPTLTITDATRVLVRNGPTGGNLSDVSIENTIIAGLDEVALDAYSIQFLGLQVDDVPFIAIGQQRGLGTTDWESLNYEELSL